MLAAHGLCPDSPSDGRLFGLDSVLLIISLLGWQVRAVMHHRSSILRSFVLAIEVGDSVTCRAL